MHFRLTAIHKAMIAFLLKIRLCHNFVLLAKMPLKHKINHNCTTFARIIKIIILIHLKKKNISSLMFLTLVRLPPPPFLQYNHLYNFS